MVTGARTVASLCWLVSLLARQSPAQSQEADLDGVFVREGEPVLAFWRRHEDAPRLIAALCPLLLPDCLAAYLLLLDLLFAGALCAPHSATEGRVTTIYTAVSTSLFSWLVGREACWRQSSIARQQHTARPPLCAPGRRRHQPAHIDISELVLGEDGAEVGYSLAHGWYLLEVVLAFVDDGAPAVVVNVLQDLGDGAVVEPVLLAGANPVDLEANLKFKNVTGRVSGH